MSIEKSVLRWGGLSGIVAGIMSILFIVILVAFVPPVPAKLEEVVVRWPDIRVAFTLGEIIYTVAVVFLVPLFLALYRTLRGTSQAPALFGTGLSLLGLALYAVGALPPIVFNRISDLYHANGATAADQATLVFLWQGFQVLFNETDTVGFLFMNVGLIVLGVAMRKTRAFGKIYGGISMMLGAAGILGLSFFAVDSALFSPFAIIAYIIFPILYGRKLYRLSKTA